MKSLLLAVLLLIVAVPATTAYATTLSLEPQPLPLNGGVVNLTADDKDRDITIDPTDTLPPNGTQTISTADATDMDINDFPPTGISVLIQNGSITVTNHPVSVGK